HATLPRRAVARPDVAAAIERQSVGARHARRERRRRIHVRRAQLPDGAALGLHAAAARFQEAPAWLASAMKKSPARSRRMPDGLQPGATLPIVPTTIRPPVGPICRTGKRSGGTARPVVHG